MFYMLTNPGIKRDNNEDYICQKYFDNNCSIYIVLDGIGGSSGGEIASRLAAEKIIEYIEKTDISTETEISDVLKDAVKYANKTIFELNKSNLAYKGMGTTLSLIYVDEKKSEIYYINVGDTRIYEIFDDKIEQITEDDTYVNALVRDNIITKHEASIHPDRHILVKAIGTSKHIAFNVNKIDYLKNKRFLICTDGLTNMLSDEKIHEIISKNNEESICNDLIKQANNAGGADNISAMYIKL